MMSTAREFANKILDIAGVRIIKKHNLDSITDSSKALKGIKIGLNRAIIVDVSGGLCNQMMCYKAARFLSENSDFILVIGSLAYENYDQGDSHWNFQLHLYPIKYDLVALGKNAMTLLLNENEVLDLRSCDILDRNGIDSVIEAAKAAKTVVIDFKFALELWRAQDRIPVPIATKDELNLDAISHLTAEDSKILNQIQNCKNPVAVHIRRGDFLSKDYDLALPKKYYVESVGVLSERLENSEFFIFSDDIAWIQDELSRFKNVSFVGHNSVDRGYVDLYLASKCKHFVLTGHSTFSHHMVELNNDQPGRIIITNEASDLETKREIEAYFTPGYCSVIRNGVITKP